MNIAIRKVIDSVFKSQKSFFVSIRTYREKAVQIGHFLPIFGL